ncbi:hypothetical protein BS50DRAFT_326513 [Corynespora cassiicola Philippines]|uniref:Uncharacterized protein n=1 Tax=Corynespora cassiicola Philippines TaxID=1448308 RepID=A0A2T2NTZ1_CORCC|nr:hypothetical protein BS50DRAFT_326513 [Corynespora cassiicola Philippines]
MPPRLNAVQNLTSTHPATPTDANSCIRNANASAMPARSFSIPILRAPSPCNTLPHPPWSSKPTTQYISRLASPHPNLYAHGRPSLPLATSITHVQLIPQPANLLHRPNAGILALSPPSNRASHV